MSDPKRWRDGGGAPGGASELLARARRSRPMTKTERERVAHRVDRIAALPAAVGMVLWLKGLAAAAGIVTTAIVIARGPALWSDAAAPPVTPSTAVSGTGHHGRAGGSDDKAPSSGGPRAAAAPALPGAPPSPPDTAPAGAAPASGAGASSSKAASAPATSTSASAEADARTSLEREAELLEEARVLLDGRPAEALVRLQQHAASFPRGKLGQERELLIVDALRRLGRTAEARARGEALLARSGGGLYAARIRSLLDSMP